MQVDKVLLREYPWRNPFLRVWKLVLLVLLLLLLLRLVLVLVLVLEMVLVSVRMTVMVVVMMVVRHVRVRMGFFLVFLVLLQENGVELMLLRVVYILNGGVFHERFWVPITVWQLERGLHVLFSAGSIAQCPTCGGRGR